MEDLANGLSPREALAVEKGDLEPLRQVIAGFERRAGRWRGTPGLLKSQ
jgi:hypothetical protein